VTEPKVRLLVVDDDAQIIRLYVDVLQREGFEVATALDVKTATAKIDELKGDVSVLIVDLGLPDGDGAEFSRTVGQKYGPKSTIFVSGWTDEFWQLQDVQGHWLIMQKPVAPKKLIAAVRWLVRGGPKPTELDDS
jgi:DNA-binding response OmpR family regulator